jgi:hypothetical protein
VAVEARLAHNDAIGTLHKWMTLFAAPAARPTGSVLPPFTHRRDLMA